MTIEEYLKLLSRDSNKEKEYNSFYTENASKFNVTIYKYQGSFIYHVLIPSSKTNVSYDVIIELPGAIRTQNEFLLDRKFTIYSNSPSFIYKYASVYKGKDLLCKWLDKKYGDIQETKSDDVVEKSISLAFIFLQATGKFITPVVKGNSKGLSIRRQLIDKIKSFEETLNERNEAPTKKKEQTSNTPIKKPVSNNNKSSKIPNKKTITTKTTKDTKTTKSEKTTVNTKNSKYVKKR